MQIKIANGCTLRGVAMLSLMFPHSRKHMSKLIAGPRGRVCSKPDTQCVKLINRKKELLDVTIQGKSNIRRNYLHTFN